MAVLVSGATIKREITANASSPETTSQSPQSTSTETTMVTNAVSPENKTDTQTSKVDAPESGVEVEKVKIVNGSATEELANESDKPFVFDLSR